MTRADAWKKRDCVQRYWNFRDHCRLLDFKIPDKPFRLVFVIPMSDSWSDKKKEQKQLTPHTHKPDIDNLCKAAFDAVCEDDAFIHDCRLTKIWAAHGDTIGGMILADIDAPFDEIIAILQKPKI